MKSRRALVVVLVVLTIVFAGVSAIEYSEVSQLNTRVSTLLTEQRGGQSSGGVNVQSSGQFGATGEIVVGNVGTYDYEVANYTSPNTFVFENVTFTSIPQVTTGALCAEFNATIPSGQTFSLEACAFDVYLNTGPSPGTAMQSVLAFSNQTAPVVGVMLLADRSAYVLVRSG